MKKITLLLCVGLLCSFTAMAQFSFPANAGPIVNGSAAPVIVGVNDAANSAAVPAGSYATFEVTADWANLDNAWSSEARLSIVTNAGATNPAAATSGALSSTAATTLTFTGALTGPYDPVIDGTLDLSLTRTFTSDAEWTNIVVTITPALACAPAAGTTTLVENCATSEFSVDVDVTDLGDSTTVTVANDAGVASTDVTALGIVTVGPFPAGTPVVISLNHESDVLCNVDLAAVVDNCPEAFTVDCVAGTPINVTYCYDSSEDKQWIFTSTDGSALRVDFVEGYFEDCCDDIIIYDGAATTDPVLFMSDGSEGDDATGISAISTGDTMLIRMDSDGSVDCASGSGTAIPLNFNVICNTCTPAIVTATVVDDCAVSGGFNILVDVTDLGSATSLTISDDQASPTQPATAAGMFTFGPYVNGTVVAITVVNDQDAACTSPFSGLTQAACPPINDACAGAITINSGETLAGDSSAATNVEALTPCSGGTVGTTCDAAGDATPNAGTIDFGAGVWYVYSSPGNESISIVADDFDTELQVFSGACGALVCVAGDDDSSNNGSGAFVCFDAATATDYYIYVDGHATNVGTFTLTLNTTLLPPANDECAAAEALTLGVEISADNTGATDSAVTPDCFTGAVADLWYSFTATTTTEAYITTTAAQYGVYSGICTALVEVACNTSPVTGLVDGVVYYVRVSDNGTARAQAPGAFTLQVTEAALGTTEFNTDSLFSYYPNPVNNNLTLNAQKEISNVSVYNMIGQEVYRDTPNAVSNEVNMSSLQAGAYFVKVTVNNVTETIKVIKK